MTREEALNKYVIPALDNTWNNKTVKQVLEALERSRWIPVSEALPEKNQRVIVCYETMEGLKVDISMFDKYGCLIGKAVAWMPLPEPYRGRK